MIENHYGYGYLSEKAIEGSMRRASNGFQSAMRFSDWDKPCNTITAQLAKDPTTLMPPIEPRGEIPLTIYDVTPQQPSNGLTVAEVFAGGGLMAVGLKTAGFQLVWANDFEKTAVAAYKHNLGDHIVHGDITQIDPNDIPDTDIIAGGPPCQDYSVAGAGAGEDGERGKLVWTYLNLIEVKQPKAFVFENVKGLIQKKHRHTFDALLVEFERIGYTVSWQLVNSWDYGVAQKRERVFIVGIRKDLGFEYEFPQPEEGDVRTQVLRDVIGDLPEPFSNHAPQPLSEAVQEKFEDGGYDNYLKSKRLPTMSEASPTVIGQWHKGPPHGLFYPDNHNAEKFPQYIQNILDGKSKTNFGVMPISDLDDPARTLLATYGNKKPTELHPNHDSKSFWTPPSEYEYGQANRVQDMDGPSNTIPAHHNSGQPQHPTQSPRRFTVRECLRIQSVPDWYVIPEMSLGAQYRIVGNGVASRVAWYIGRALAEQLWEAML